MKRFHIVENCTECGFFRKEHGFDFFCVHDKAEARVYMPKTFTEQTLNKQELYKNCPLGIMMETDAL